MQEYARKAGLNVSVNCVYDGSRELIGLYAGDVDDAWREAVKGCYRAHDTKTAPKSDIVIANAYPQADQDIDWWGAQESLREGGTAVAIHHFTMGSALLHYRGEQMGAPWRRMQSYPQKRWPVERAENTIVYTNRLSKRHMLVYADNVEWLTEWDSVLQKLRDIHGEEASVAVYPNGKIQFDSAKNPLSI
jgi:nickel-dependent lactate racemase